MLDNGTRETETCCQINTLFPLISNFWCRRILPATWLENPPKTCTNTRIQIRNLANHHQYPCGNNYAEEQSTPCEDPHVTGQHKDGLPFGTTLLKMIHNRTKYTHKSQNTLTPFKKFLCTMYCTLLTIGTV